jgi:PhoH-like ATPase
MKKTYVLDTNVLLHDPQSLFAFEDNDVVIPIYVIEEVDTFKKDMSELGRNARQVARHLDAMRQQGKLSEGIPNESGGRLFVAYTSRELQREFFADGHMADNRILATALEVKQKNKDKPTVFVTKDIALRIRADALGVSVEDYEADKADESEHYTGVVEVDTDGEQIDAFYRDGYVNLWDPSWSPNQFVIIRNRENASHTALGKVAWDQKRVEPILRLKDGMWGIRPRNKEQSFACDLLMNDDIKLVTLIGRAGTGKTLLAVAAGLQKVTEENVFQKLLVSRPVMPLGKDIGFLPGDVEEKMSPWMQPIYDNVEFLMGLSQRDKKSGRGHHELIDMGIIEIEPLTYIRGRSIPNQYMIVDEAQNLTPHEVKTILTRAGDNTKIVLAGDPYQIDNPYVDAMNNGLVYVMNHFRQQRIAGHVTLSKGERSDLAELAANIL